jgi:hypothetical protein
VDIRGELRYSGRGLTLKLRDRRLIGGVIKRSTGGNDEARPWKTGLLLGFAAGPEEELLLLEGIVISAGG